MSRTLPSPNCNLCNSSLLVSSESDDPNLPQYFLDDIELSCSHHFHWACYTEYSEDGGDRSTCPTCHKYVLSSEEKLLVVVRNEGGTTSGYDLGADLDEEKEMDANPQLKYQRAFIELMTIRDFASAEKLLHGTSGEAEDAIDPVDVNCRWDNDGHTALHFAARYNDVEAIVLLLQHSADRTLLNHEGKTPRDLALINGLGKAVDLLS